MKFGFSNFDYKPKETNTNGPAPFFSSPRQRSF